MLRFICWKFCLTRNPTEPPINEELIKLMSLIPRGGSTALLKLMSIITQRQKLFASSEPFNYVDTVARIGFSGNIFETDSSQLKEKLSLKL